MLRSYLRRRRIRYLRLLLDAPTGVERPRRKLEEELETLYGRENERYLRKRRPQPPQNMRASR